jgi:hypothetical protein
MKNFKDILKTYADLKGHNYNQLLKDYLSETEDNQKTFITNIMQTGGEEDQVSQIIMAFAELTQQDPQQIMEQIQSLQPEQQQAVLQQMVQKLQGGDEQEAVHNLQEEQTEMKLGGHDLQSVMGYRDDSPFRNRNKNLIKSNRITMDETGIPLLGISNTGDMQYMGPYSGDYEFDGQEVTEYPLAQTGKRSKQEIINDIKNHALKKNKFIPEKINSIGRLYEYLETSKTNDKKDFTKNDLELYTRYLEKYLNPYEKETNWVGFKEQINKSTNPVDIVFRNTAKGIGSVVNTVKDSYNDFFNSKGYDKLDAERNKKFIKDLLMNPNVNRSKSKFHGDEGSSDVVDAMGNPLNGGFSNDYKNVKIFNPSTSTEQSRLQARINSSKNQNDPNSLSLDEIKSGKKKVSLNQPKQTNNNIPVKVSNPSDLNFEGNFSGTKIYTDDKGNKYAQKPGQFEVELIEATKPKNNTKIYKDKKQISNTKPNNLSHNNKTSSGNSRFSPTNLPDPSTADYVEPPTNDHVFEQNKDQLTKAFEIDGYDKTADFKLLENNTETPYKAKPFEDVFQPAGERQKNKSLLKFKLNNPLAHIANSMAMTQAFSPAALPYLQKSRTNYTETPVIDPRLYIQQVNEVFNPIKSGINLNSTTGQAYAASIAGQQASKITEVLNEVNAKNQQIIANNNAQRVNAQNNDYGRNEGFRNQYYNEYLQNQSTRDASINSVMNQIAQTKERQIAQENSLNSELFNAPWLEDETSDFDRIMGNKTIGLDKVRFLEILNQRNKAQYGTKRKKLLR